jgi:hypothetical protein
MRAEPWLDGIRHVIKPVISFGCDYCATDRRKRDVACWHKTDVVFPSSNVCLCS